MRAAGLTFSTSTRTAVGALRAAGAFSRRGPADAFTTTFEATHTHSTIVQCEG